MSKFTWDVAIKRKKVKKPEWMKAESQELLMKSVMSLFDSRNKEIKPFSKYYHPSQVYDMCVLQEYYRRVYKIDSIDESDMYMRLMAEAGTAAHKCFQEKIFGPAGILVGDWHCTVCGNAIAIDCLMPKKCDKCGSDRDKMRYAEKQIQDDDLMIMGKPDGILAFEYVRDMLLEMKTKGTITFEKITAPSRKELFQVHLYMHLLGLEECMFVYICRENYDFKFIVAKKDQDILDEVLNKISVIEEAIKAGEPPRKEDGKPYRRCRKCDSQVAENCPFNKECWELEDE